MITTKRPPSREEILAAFASVIANKRASLIGKQRLTMRYDDLDAKQLERLTAGYDFLVEHLPR